MYEHHACTCMRNSSDSYIIQCTKRNIIYTYIHIDVIMVGEHLRSFANHEVVEWGWIERLVGRRDLT